MCGGGGEDYLFYSGNFYLRTRVCVLTYVRCEVIGSQLPDAADHQLIILGVIKEAQAGDYSIHQNTK